MTDKPKVQAPPAPPAPPSAAAIPTVAGTPGVMAPAPKTPQEDLLQMAEDLTRIGSAVPTPNVVDSDIHGRQLHEIAAKLRKLAGKK
jgi:hypothetical protein